MTRKNKAVIDKVIFILSMTAIFLFCYTKKALLYTIFNVEKYK